LQNAAVYVNPSMVESYSISLAEAMAVGCPCITSYAGAMPEVGGEACLYFPIADAGVLAARIDEVLTRGCGNVKISERLRNKSLSDHNTYKAILRQKEIYGEVIHNV